MRTIELTSKEFQTIPGYSTKLSPAVWRGKIDTLLYMLDELESVSVEDQIWRRQKGIQMQTLLLDLNILVGNVQRRIQFQLEPVLIRRKVMRGRSLNKIVDEEKVSWKLFHDLLQQKLAAARLGMVEIQHELMPYIAKQLPDGSMGTFAEFMDMVIETQGLDGLQLEYKPERKTIEVKVEKVN